MTATTPPDRPLTRNTSTVMMVWTRELIRLKRMPTRLITGIATPILYLFVLGAGMKNLVNSPQAFSAAGAGATFDYQEYLFPGIMAMSIITSALFSAMSIVWDREFGFMREMLVAPVSRTGLVLGKALGGGTVAVIQGVILIVVAPLVGVDLTVTRVVGLVGALLLLAFALTAFGIVLGARMQRMESFQMVATLVTQPMIFLSGAIFPLKSLPSWLNVLTRVNPATYGVDLVRRTLLPGAPAVTWNGNVVPLWADACVVLVLGGLMLALASALFRQSD